MQSPISERPRELVEVFFLGVQGILSSWGTGGGLSSRRAGRSLFLVRGWDIVLTSVVSVWPTQPREENVKHAAFLDGFLHHQPVLAQLLGSRQIGTCGGYFI